MLKKDEAPHTDMTYFMPLSSKNPRYGWNAQANDDIEDAFKTWCNGSNAQTMAETGYIKEGLGEFSRSDLS